MKRKTTVIVTTLCILAFVAAIWGSIYCGRQLMVEQLSEEREQYLWRLIYFHFFLSQISLLILALLYSLRQQRSKKYYIIVSYSEQGKGINPLGVDIPSSRVYHTSLGKIDPQKLPPLTAPTLVYPMMMQSGYSSGERLEEELRLAYSARYGEEQDKKQLYMQPVLGASPHLVKLIEKSLVTRGLNDDDGILLVAHAPAHINYAPEPMLCVSRLKKSLKRPEIAYTYLEGAVETLREMSASRVHIVPFLLTRGYHAINDLPTETMADEMGKKLIYHPVIENMMRES